MRGSKISNRNSNRRIAYKNTLRKFLFTKKKEIVEAVETGHICKCYSCTKCLKSITVDDDCCLKITTCNSGNKSFWKYNKIFLKINSGSLYITISINTVKGTVNKNELIEI